MFYNIGDVVRVRGTLTDASDVAVDPSTVSVKVRPPTGSTLTYTYALATVTKEETGIYYKDISVTESGKWYYQFVSTGTGQAMDEGAFVVKSSAIA